MRKVIPNQEFLRLMFVGRPGSTKTRTAYSAVMDERTAPVLGLDCGGQPRSIAEYQPQPDIIGIEKVADLSRIYKWLVEGQKPSDSLVRELQLSPPYKTLIIDGLSEIQRLIVLEASGNASAGPGDRVSPVEIRHYGDILARTLTIAERFYRLQLHVISTVLEQERQEGENGPVTYRPQVVGQARDQLASYPEVVGRLMHVDKLSTTVKGQLGKALTSDASAVCFFRPSPRHEAKDQTGKLGDFIVDPTLTKIMDLLGGSLQLERIRSVAVSQESEAEVQFPIAS